MEKNFKMIHVDGHQNLQSLYCMLFMEFELVSVQSVKQYSTISLKLVFCVQQYMVQSHIVSKPSYNKLDVYFDLLVIFSFSENVTNHVR